MLNAAWYKIIDIWRQKKQVVTIDSLKLLHLNKISRPFNLLFFEISTNVNSRSPRPGFEVRGPGMASEKWR